MRLLLQSSRQEKTEKREENGLTFAGEGVYCCLETGSAFARGGLIRAHFIVYFSKRNRKPTKFQPQKPFAAESKYASKGPVCLQTCWAFLCRSVAGSWSDLRFHVWESSGFFVFGRFLKTNSNNLYSPSNKQNQPQLKKRPKRQKTLESSQKYRKKFGFPLRKPAFERLTNR